MTECSEASAYKIQTPGNYPKENIQHIEQGENLKRKIILPVYFYTMYSKNTLIKLQHNYTILNK
jgi:hypothetical protein